MKSLKEIAYKWYPQAQVFRRAFSSAAAMFVAVYVDRYYSFLHEFWVTLATILVLQMTVRTNFTQGILRFFVIMAAVLFGSILVIYLPVSLYLASFLIFIFIVGCFLHNYFPVRPSGFSPELMVALIMLMMLVPFTTQGNVLYERLHDVALGGLIGIISGLIIFPGRPDVDFRIGVVPVLRSYSLYLSAITELFFQEANAKLNADSQKAAIEKVFQSCEVFFPAWVYESGFNVKLREGHRHFLMRVEQMGQVLFAMNYAAHFKVDMGVIEKFRTAILCCVDDFKMVINNIITVLNTAELTTTNSNFNDDLTQLENSFHSEMNMPIELAETSADYMHVVNFLYGLRDLQKISEKLEESLREYITHLAYP